MSGRGHYLLAFATVALVGLAVEILLGPAVPLRSIDEFPLRIGSWTGSPEPIDTSFLQRARPDQVLNRKYLDEVERAVLLYIGYYERQASRAQVLAVCSGECQVWGTESETIVIHGGDSLEVKRAWVRQSGIPMTVVYWYQEGSWVIQDRYRDRLARVSRAFVDRRSNGALVRVSTRIETTEAEARARSVAFLRALAPLLRSHLPH